MTRISATEYARVMISNHTVDTVYELSELWLPEILHLSCIHKTKNSLPFLHELRLKLYSLCVQLCLGNTLPVNAVCLFRDFKTLILLCSP